MTEIEILDIAAIEENFGGKDNIRKSKNILSACVNTFLKTVDKRFASLESAIELEQKNTVELIAHQLKGTFLTLGSGAMANTFKSMETEADKLSKGDLLALMKNASQNLPSFKVKLEDYLNKIS